MTDNEKRQFNEMLATLTAIAKAHPTPHQIDVDAKNGRLPQGFTVEKELRRNYDSMQLKAKWLTMRITPID